MSFTIELLCAIRVEMFQSPGESESQRIQGTTERRRGRRVWVVVVGGDGDGGGGAVVLIRS